MLADQAYFDEVELALQSHGHTLLYRTQTDTCNHRPLPDWQGKSYIRVTSLIFNLPGAAVIYKLECVEAPDEDFRRWEAWMCADLSLERLRSTGWPNFLPLAASWDSSLLKAGGSGIHDAGTVITFDSFFQQIEPWDGALPQPGDLADETHMLVEHVRPYATPRLSQLRAYILVPASVFPGSWRKFKAEFPTGMLQQLVEDLGEDWQPSSWWWRPSQ